MTPRDPADVRHGVQTRQVFEGVTDVLLARGQVVIDGFGTFKLVRRKPHRTRNPRTGDRIDVAGKTVVRFTPSRSLKFRVAGITEFPND
jgi:integration host factor subunit beta